MGLFISQPLFGNLLPYVPDNQREIVCSCGFSCFFPKNSYSRISSSNTACWTWWFASTRFNHINPTIPARPIYHKCDKTIRGHVFCSFLALILRKELQRRIECKGYHFEWSNIKQDLKALQETAIHENGRSFAIRSECQGVCGKVFQAVGIAVQSTIREI